MSLKFNLKELMKIRGITLSELSKETGLSINTLSLLSTGKTQGIQFDTLDKIMTVLNCSVGTLITEDNEKSKLLHQINKLEAEKEEIEEKLITLKQKLEEL
ncbi:XRE family transcriptional regulator [Macrococcoides goetzii]|nr:helix-turn-helix transcriptional regulator [Macrococcus goetzii]TDM39866.1 XRE family transcriptional regulator [Macrococcus goetzii]